MAGKKRLKIRGVSSPSRRYGIVASNIGELIRKGCEKLSVPEPGALLYLEKDGTLVVDEEFFQHLDRDECLVLVADGEAWGAGANALNQVFNDLEQRAINVGLVTAEDIAHASLAERFALIAGHLDEIRDNILAERREDDPPWFEGVPNWYDKKSDFMAFLVKQRLKNYFYKTKDDLRRGSPASISRDFLTVFMEKLSDSLKGNEWHGTYFDRLAEVEARLCDSNGWFPCEGLYNVDRCSVDHRTNPYSTRESRVIFGHCWNLDHVIERSRTVVPAMIDAILTCPRGKEVNVQYFYDLLFTRTNLKLVFITCHDKRAHNRQVNSASLFRDAQN